MELNDNYFGKIIITNDTKKQTNSFGFNMKCFGDNHVYAKNLQHTKDIQISLHNLKLFCENKDEMKSRLISEYTSHLAKQELNDENDNPITITEQLLEQKLEFNEIVVLGPALFEIHAGWDELPDDYSIVYNSESDSFDSFKINIID